MNRCIVFLVFLVFACVGFDSALAQSTVTVPIGSHCLESRFGSESKCDANRQSECVSAVSRNRCGMEHTHPPVGQQFKLTGTQCSHSGPLANPYEVVCLGVFEPQPYPSCSGAYVMKAPSSGQCGEACGRCGMQYCGAGNGTCIGGSHSLCQDPEGGAELFCDCGTSVQCNGGYPHQVVPETVK